MTKEEKKEKYDVNKKSTEGESYTAPPHADMPFGYLDIINKPTGELVSKEEREKEYELTTGKSYVDIFFYFRKRFPFYFWYAIFLIIIGVFSGRIFEIKNLPFFGCFWLFLILLHLLFSKKFKR